VSPPLLNGVVAVAVFLIAVDADARSPVCAHQHICCSHEAVAVISSSISLMSARFCALFVLLQEQLILSPLLPRHQPSFIVVISSSLSLMSARCRAL
jgi:hypothetical protein